jgi:hypothetical protein
VNRFWAKAVAARFKGVVCSAIDPASLGDLLAEIEKRVWDEDSSGTRTDPVETSGVQISS